MRYLVKAFLGAIFFVSIANIMAIAGENMHHHKPGKSSYSFVSNEGQWNNAILFRTALPSGNLYFEHGRLVYNMIDPDFFDELHQHDGKLDLNNLTLRQHNFHVNFKGANKKPNIISDFPLIEYHNYFLGNDSSKWVGNVPLYSMLTYKNLYDGVDMVVYADGDHLKYEFEVSAGADAEAIQLDYRGVDKVRLKGEQLWIKLSMMDIYESSPIAYQIVDGKKKQIKCNFKIENNVVGFEFYEDYVPNKKLIIDPTLIFSSYSGSTSNNFGYTAAGDDLGYLYTGGTAFGQAYDTTLGAFQTNYRGGIGTGGPGVDIVISKFDTNGTKLIYSTFLGGTGDEQPHSLIVNDQHQLYVYGTTGSTNFPTTINAYQRNLKSPNTANNVTPGSSSMGIRYDQGSDIFITKFDSAGANLRGSTYIGGTKNDGLNNAFGTAVTRYNYGDENRGEVDLDEFGNVYVASSTESSDFPIVGNVFDRTFGGGGQDAIVFKMSTDLSFLVWSSFLGGSNIDAGYAIAIDKNNDVVVAGGTNSLNYFGRSSSAFPSFQRGRTDGYITHIKGDGTAIINTTYFGTTFYDQTYFVELDKHGNKYVLGQTEDPTGKLVTNATYRVSTAGQFVAKLSPKLDNVLWSTRFGVPGLISGFARPSLSPTAFLVDLCQSIYIAGWGGGVNISTLGSGHYGNRAIAMAGMDTTTDALYKVPNGGDFYMMVLSDNAASLEYASFYGGGANEHVDGGTSRFDKKGKMYQSVCADCLDRPGTFPTTTGAHATAKGSAATNCNNAVFKMDFLLPVVVADFTVPREVCIGDSVQINNLSKEFKRTSYLWTVSNGFTSTLKDPGKIAFDTAGGYTITLVLADTAACNTFDTLTRFVSVIAPNVGRYANDTICQKDTIQIGFFQPNRFKSTWFPDSSVSNRNAHRPLAFPTGTTDFLQLLETGICVDTWRLFMHVDSLIISDYEFSDSVCIPAVVTIKNNSQILGNSTFKWDLDGLDTSTQLEPTFQVSQPGTYRLVFTIEDTTACHEKDSLVRFLVALKDSTYLLPDTMICLGDTVQIGVPLPPIYSYKWTPTNSLDNPNVAQPNAFPKIDTKYELQVTKSVCTDTYRLAMEVDSVILAQFQLSDSVCIPDLAPISNNSLLLQNTKYIWDLGGIDTSTMLEPVLDIHNKGLYTVVFYIEDTSSCNLRDTAFTVIEGKSDTSFTLNPQLICNNIAEAIGLPPNSGFSYFWNTSHGLVDSNSSSTLAAPKTDTTYWLHIDKGVCTDTAYQKVFKDTISTVTDDRRDVCSQNRIAVISANSFGTASNFHWSNFKDFSNTIPTNPNDSTITYIPTDFKSTLHVKGTSTRGCEERDSIVLFVNDWGIHTDTSKGKCLSDTIQIKVFSDVPGDKLTAKWKPFENIISADDTTHILVNPATTKTYYVDVVNKIGCERFDSVIVNVSKLRLDTSSITASKDTILKIWNTQLSSYPLGYNYEWTPEGSLSDPNIDNPLAFPKATTDYVLRIYDPEYPDCEVVNTKRIYVEELFCEEPYLFLPNSFTPNNDGINDILFLQGKYVGDIKLQIFNRWGQMVFESTDQNVGWDGTFNGEPVNPDVFAYYLFVRCIDDQEFEKKGDITLIR